MAFAARRSLLRNSPATSLLEDSCERFGLTKNERSANKNAFDRPEEKVRVPSSTGALVRAAIVVILSRDASLALTQRPPAWATIPCLILNPIVVLRG